MDNQFETPSLITHLKPETQALAFNVNGGLEPVPFILEAVEDIDKVFGNTDEETRRKVLAILADLSEKVADWENEAVADGLPLGIGDIIAPWLSRCK